MPLDFDLGDIFTGGDVWTWFQLTGSAVVWVVTFGQVWLMDSREHWAGFIGLMLQVGLIAGVICVQQTDDAKQNQRVKPMAADAEGPLAPQGA